MAGVVKQLLARPIQVADMVTKAADEAQSFKQDCQEIKGKTEKLAGLLRQVARASNDIYERPTRRIVDETEQVLDKALTLVLKCGATGFLGRLFTIIPAAAFRKLSMQLENSIGDVSWLLAVSGDNRDDEYLGLPPIAANEPILCLIWEQIANLYTGTLEERADASASLVSLARDNDRYGKLIIEEGGVVPLLKLAKEGNPEGQENAARAIGLLGRDAESVEQIVNAGVCAVFAKILKEGQMKVQSIVAWAVSELAAHHPKCQDHFSQNNIIRFLVSHIAFETVQEHSKYTIVNKQGVSSIHSVLVASKGPDSHKKEETESNINRPLGNRAAPTQMQNVVANTLKGKNPTPPQPNNQANHPKGSQQVSHAKSNHHPHHVSISGTSIKGREFEDPATKAQMKAMAARALWQLCKGNLSICRSITESRALLCFAILLEKSTDDVKYYSAMALMEITAVAEQNADLRRSSFKPTSPAAKAVVDQLLKIIEKTDTELLVPCIKTIGHLARTFRATETRIVTPLVKLLDETEPEVSMEAVMALNKFATPKNFLHVNHSKAIVKAGGVKHLIQLVYFGEQMVQFPSLTLLCYIAYNIPDSEVLAQDEVLIVLEWASKQAHLSGDPDIDDLLPEAKSRLELYQSRDIFRRLTWQPHHLRCNVCNIKWFTDQRGFGFITPDDGGEELFVHQSSIRSDGFRSLADGEEVEFVIDSSEGGRTKAVDVTGPNGNPVRGTTRSGRSGGGGGFGGRGRRGGYGGGRGGCFKCGELGHMARDCGQGGGGGGSGLSCYNCGGSGHFARDCSNSDR